MTYTILDIGERAEAATLLGGVLLSIAAAYYTGATGNWLPLLFVCVGTGLLVVLNE
ncbi:hypothetical protein Natpe_0133 [Natrinema pellirubrum DSM 15624]|uniref:Uncharacterized protein n=1 Tax=Natrinema pellirubrum (strain DSM 15624 / CIP 106293 / JCM 10476 / NCIMB 786 / 157) TaxID=797303 RepID=L0JEV3_NATP1|nr:hypothetical protein [Natrinema pellirubrum]AGB30075.1 hypothetical protein Natpe_0133 [Natrinema pellirubrum DSM 15624]